MPRIDLDVSNLEPCEPMERILLGAENLKTGDWLRVVHRREPNPLFPLLQKRGFEWIMQTLGDDGVVLRIWLQGDGAAREAAGADRGL